VWWNVRGKGCCTRDKLFVFALTAAERTSSCSVGWAISLLIEGRIGLSQAFCDERRDC
jgi:hypothetical protein